MKIFDVIKSFNMEYIVNHFNTLIDTIDHAKWTIGSSPPVNTQK